MPSVDKLISNFIAIYLSILLSIAISVSPTDAISPEFIPSSTQSHDIHRVP